MANTARGVRKKREGVVVSDAMDKTIVVRVEQRYHHPVFDKVMRRHAKFYAHDEKNEAGLGDEVRIEEIRPMSRLKRWRLVEIVKSAKAQASGS